MKRGKGKSKGSAYERQICKILSLWISGGKRDDIFWRSALSGGRATVRTKQGKSTKGQYGDIQATDRIGEKLLSFCVVEVKCGYGNTVASDVLDSMSQPCQWSKWVVQADKAADEGGLPGWLLITKRDRRKALVFMPVILQERFEKLPGTPDLACLRVRCRIPSKRHSIWVVGFCLDEFLETYRIWHKK